MPLITFKQLFECSLCNTPYDTKEDAEKCESNAVDVTLEGKLVKVLQCPEYVEDTNNSITYSDRFLYETLFIAIDPSFQKVEAGTPYVSRDQHKVWYIIKEVPHEGRRKFFLEYKPKNSTKTDEEYIDSQCARIKAPQTSLEPALKKVSILHRKW